jgi:hypothetical protein
MAQNNTIVGVVKKKKGPIRLPMLEEATLREVDSRHHRRAILSIVIDRAAV